MHFAIITNPVSGKMTSDQKRSALSEAAQILDADIHGLDTFTADDLGRCASELSGHCDVLVVAGGDGTLSQIINSIDTAKKPIAYLPLGTGNAMGHALNYKGNLSHIAKRIREGAIYEFDLINCGNKKRTLMASIGIEGHITRLRDTYLAQGATGFKSYLQAVMKAYSKEYQRVSSRLTFNGETLQMNKLLSLIVTKHPYYGFGMKVVPRARLDDRRLHVLHISCGRLKSLLGWVTSFTVGNRIGHYRSGRRVTVTLGRPVSLQLDGTYAWDAHTFAFALLPKALKMQC